MSPMWYYCWGSLQVLMFIEMVLFLWLILCLQWRLYIYTHRGIDWLFGKSREEIDRDYPVDPVAFVRKEWTEDADPAAVREDEQCLDGNGR